MALANYGFSVECAQSSREALMLLHLGKYDVIVSDVNMADGDGIGLLGLLRGRADLTPVVLMSGRPSADGGAGALARGAFRYMVKPVMPSELRRVIESAIASYRGTMPSSLTSGPLP